MLVIFYRELFVAQSEVNAPKELTADPVMLNAQFNDLAGLISKSLNEIQAVRPLIHTFLFITR